MWEEKNQVSRIRVGISGKEKDTVVGHMRSESFSALRAEGMCTGITVVRGGHTRCLL